VENFFQHIMWQQPLSLLASLPIECMNAVHRPMNSPAAGSALDREVALSRVGGDSELLKEIAVLFLANYQVWLGELREAAIRGDAKGVENTAHGLKGSVSNFGAHAAVEAALQLETLGRNRDLTGVSTSLAALESALEALRPELESL
jgi:HPt (histidine-containing phosphotransfer) domain-containing protein